MGSDLTHPSGPRPSTSIARETAGFFQSRGETDDLPVMRCHHAGLSPAVTCFRHADVDADHLRFASVREPELVRPDVFAAVGRIERVDHRDVEPRSADDGGVHDTVGGEHPIVAPPGVESVAATTAGESVIAPI